MKLSYILIILSHFIVNFIINSSVHGGAVVLLPPWASQGVQDGFLGKDKNQMFWVKKELALVIKGVFPPLKSIVKNFIFKFYLGISILSNLHPTAYLINNYR